MINFAFVVDIVVLALLLVTAVAIARMKDLFAIVMLSGIYGLLSAAFFVSLDAVDVAFTEAAVGAGISPLLFLSVLKLTGRYEDGSHSHAVFALLLVVVTGMALVAGTLDMPAFGDPDSPASSHVAVRYLEESGREIDIPNVVTSVLASYRGYDTFGEAVVIFTAAVGVLSLLGLLSGPREGRESPVRMGDHLVLRLVSEMLIPLILLFALYVQFHGEYGPGGGFQAGVIFAAAVILYAMLFGLHAAQRVARPAVLRALASLGVLVYGSVGVVSLLAGGTFLDYSVLSADPVSGQHLGIIVIELGVGVTVASTMILIFFAFTSRSDAAHPEASR
ncbi:MAG: Na(+)/H(+) antiporter subunit B [Chromatocurvus sp.]